MFVDKEQDELTHTFDVQMLLPPPINVRIMNIPGWYKVIIRMRYAGIILHLGWKIINAEEMKTVIDTTYSRFFA